jgi:hypothetical protein
LRHCRSTFRQEAHMLGESIILIGYAILVLSAVIASHGTE